MMETKQRRQLPVLAPPQKTRMTGCRPIDTPIEFNVKLGDSVILLTKFPLIKRGINVLVGKLIHLSYTRPDISYVVNIVSQFMQAPYEEQMEAMNRNLRYLKSSPSKGLMFRKIDRKCIETYTDSDWAGSIIDKKSTAGYFIFV